jgi:hypothetical protein
MTDNCTRFAIHYPHASLEFSFVTGMASAIGYQQAFVANGEFRADQITVESHPKPAKKDHPSG